MLRYHEFDHERTPIDIINTLREQIRDIKEDLENLKKQFNKALKVCKKDG